MIDEQRFRWAAVVGLLAVALFTLQALRDPATVLALAGDSSSNGARVYVDDQRIGALRLGGAEVAGEQTAHLEIIDLPETGVFLIQRDIDFSAIAPTAQDYTMTVRAPMTSEPDGVDLFTTNACVEGVGLTRLGLLEGLLDPAINDALRDGYNPSLITGLLNLVGPAGLVDVTIDEFWAEAVLIESPDFQAPQGLEVTTVARSVSPEFEGSPCL